MIGILTIMKKEFARFFGDKRMIIMVLLPAVLIYVVYTFMGTALTTAFTPDVDHDPWAYVVNMPDSIVPWAQSHGIGIRHIEAHEVQDVKERISLRQAELCIIFPEDFDAQVEVFDVQTATGPAPNIEIFFNAADPNSTAAFNRTYSMLSAFESSLANKFDVNRGIYDADLATAEDVSATIMASMMPLLLMIFLYSGCVGFAPESIAGEKERGTLATLLVTPLGRGELAIGKILSLAALSFLSGLVMTVATILSLPNLMGGGGDMIDAGIYGLMDYLLLALVILSTILLLIALISIISAFAKTVKEANSAVMPLMVIVMLVGVTGMLGSAQTNPLYYIIPLYNSVQSMSGIFSLDYSVANILLASFSNLVYACVGGYVLTLMFNSERVMFSR